MNCRNTGTVCKCAVLDLCYTFRDGDLAFYSRRTIYQLSGCSINNTVYGLIVSTCKSEVYCFHCSTSAECFCTEIFHGSLECYRCNSCAVIKCGIRKTLCFFRNHDISGFCSCTELKLFSIFGVYDVINTLDILVVFVNGKCCQRSASLKHGTGNIRHCSTDVYCSKCCTVFENIISDLTSVQCYCCKFFTVCKYRVTNLLHRCRDCDLFQFCTTNKYIVSYCLHRLRNRNLCQSRTASEYRSLKCCKRIRKAYRCDIYTILERTCINTCYTRFYYNIFNFIDVKLFPRTAGHLSGSFDSKNTIFVQSPCKVFTAGTICNCIFYRYNAYRCHQWTVVFFRRVIPVLIRLLAVIRDLIQHRTVCSYIIGSWFTKGQFHSSVFTGGFAFQCSECAVFPGSDLNTGKSFCSCCHGSIKSQGEFFTGFNCLLDSIKACIFIGIIYIILIYGCNQIIIGFDCGYFCISYITLKRCTIEIIQSIGSINTPEFLYSQSPLTVLGHITICLSICLMSCYKCLIISQDTITVQVLNCDLLVCHRLIVFCFCKNAFVTDRYINVCRCSCCSGCFLSCVESILLSCGKIICKIEILCLFGIFLCDLFCTCAAVLCHIQFLGVFFLHSFLFCRSFCGFFFHVLIFRGFFCLRLFHLCICDFC